MGGTSIRQTSIARQTMLWVVVVLIGAGAIVGVTRQRQVAKRLRTKGETGAVAVSTRIGESLSEHIWNLDESAIAGYFEKYPHWGDVVRVSVLTQYGDPIYELVREDDEDSFVRRRSVLRDGEPIGAVDVAVSRREEREMSRSAAHLTALAVILGVPAIILVIRYVMKLCLERPLDRLLVGIRRIAAGNYAERLDPSRYAEIDNIGEAVNQMASQIAARTQELREEVKERRGAEAELQGMKVQLEELVDRRTEQLRLAYERLQDETEQRRKAQRRMLDAGLNEQRRIGRDLHDSIGQEMAGVAFLSASLERVLAEKGSPESATAGKIASLLRASLDKTRRIARGLDPVDVSEEGLSLSLRHLASEMRRIHKVTCKLVEGMNIGVSDNRTATHLFHIAQEACHNAVVHGNAETIEIRLTADAGRGTLSIRDDGEGFAPDKAGHQGMGMSTMHERAETVGGDLDVESVPGEGTTITVIFDGAEALDV